MKKSLFIILCLVFLSCSKEDKVYTTIIGETYICKSASGSHSLYLIYEFTTDGKISIEERLDSETGELHDTNHGYFEYNHTELKLKIQSVPDCETPGCFNNFTASVSDDRRSFTYEIWDITIGGKRDLIFHIKE